MRTQRPGTWIWLVYAGLYSLSIPWYLPPTEAPALWLGLPHWVVLSLLATTAVAGFTAYVVRCHWPAPADEPDEGTPRDRLEASNGDGGVRR